MVTYACYAWTATTSFKELKKDFCDEMYCVTLNYTLGVKVTRLNAYLVQSNKSHCLRGHGKWKAGRQAPAKCAHRRQLRQLRCPMHMQQGMLTRAQHVGVAAGGTTGQFVNAAVCQLSVLAANVFMGTQQKLQCYKLLQSGLTGLAKG